MEKSSYVKLREVIDPTKFRFWNKGSWTSGKILFSHAKTKTVHGGNYRIASYKQSRCKTITTKPENYRAVGSVIKKCKNGSIHQNDWMKSGKKD